MAVGCRHRLNNERSLFHYQYRFDPVALTFITWLWGLKYTPEYVWRLHRGLKRNLKQPFRFILMTEQNRSIEIPDDIERHTIKDIQLTGIKGCFARLRMFDPEWQAENHLYDRIVCIDLDVIIVGECDGLFARDESLIVLRGANAANPCPFNCSVFQFRAGTHRELWSDFSLKTIVHIPQYQFPDDQGWIWHKVPDAATWQVGGTSGIYAFRKPGWRPGDRLPPDAKIVVFPGSRDPAMFVQFRWVPKNWL